MPSIRIYNLVHVFVVLLGNFQAICTYKLCRELVIAISADELLSSVTVNVFSPGYAPASGSKVRLLIHLSSSSACFWDYWA